MATLCLLAAIGCRSGITLTYEARVSQATPRELSVELRVAGLRPGETFAFRSYAVPSDSRPADVRAFDASGQPLALTASPESEHSSARYSFAAPMTGQATVRYRVLPAGRQGNAHTGFKLRRKLVLDERFALLRGRDAFLFPERAEAIGSAHVSFALPPSWRACAPWMPEGAKNGSVERRGRRALEEMLSAPLAFGSFATHRFDLAGTEYRLLLETGIPEDRRDEVTRELEEAARAVAARFDRSLEPSYLVVVLPRSSVGDEIDGDAWGTGQGATLFPLTTERFRAFTRRLADAHLQYPPRAISFLDPRDRWFAIGLREVLSLEIVAAIRHIPPDIIDRYLAHKNALVLVGESRTLNLERAFTDPATTEETKQTAVAAVAPLAVRGLERAVGGPDAFKAWFRGRSRRESIGSIWSELPLSAAHRDRLRVGWAREGRIPTGVAVEVSEIVAGPPATQARRAVARSLRVAVTAQTFGYLENCGCRVSQSGGLSRRSSFLRRLRAESPPLILIDVGSGLADLQDGPRLDDFAFAEQRAYQGIVSKLGYAAMTPGRTDLIRGLGAFEKLRAGFDMPYVAANLRLRGGSSFLPPARTFNVGGVRCRVIGVGVPMSPFYRPSSLEDALGSLDIDDPVAAVKRATADLSSEDFIIVSGEIPYRVIRDIARTCPEVDLIVASPQMYLGELPPRDHTGSMENDTPGFLGNTVVAYGDMGPYGVTVVNLGLTTDGSAVAATFERHDLNEKVGDDPSVRLDLDRFYQSLAPSTTAAAEVKSPASLWSDRTSSWVGSAACADCHESETAQWRSTPHAGAMKTLTSVHRDTQPRCVSCHVVGFGSPGGYRIAAAGTNHLANVQCENCHGPGGAHVNDPTAENIEGLVPVTVCVSCHDTEHSDAFDYAERLRSVAHGKGAAKLAKRD